MRVRDLGAVGFVLMVCVALLGVFSAPVFAGAPETPETGAASAVTASSVTLNGVLNPNAPGEPGEYEFLYSQSATECVEGAVSPVPAGLAVGFEKEAVSVGVSGLRPSTQYTFCLLERNAAEEVGVGLGVTFTTSAAPPSVDSEAVSGVSSTGGSLEAQINPNGQKTTYSFEYATNEALTGATTLPGPGPLPAGFGDQLVSVSTGGVLVAGTTYFYRVVAANGTPPASNGTLQSFTTVPLPNTDPPSAIGATSVTLNGHLTLDPVDTTYSFIYNTGGGCAGGSTTTVGDAGSGAGGEVSESTSVTGLLPGTQYTVCFVISNAYGSEQGPPVSFSTPALAPSIVSEFTSQVGPSGVTLNAQIDPDGAGTTYHFDYGTTNSYGQSTPESASIGSDNSNHTASAAIQGLQPGTTYHYRVVATNSQSLGGGTLGSDRTFVTPIADGQAPGSNHSEGCANEQLRAEQPSGLGLPDCRAYEMVSPLEKNDGDAIAGGRGGCFVEYSNRSSVSGGAIVYESPGSFGGAAGSRLCNAYVSRRGGDGWSTRSITPAHVALEGLLGGADEVFMGMAFTPDLARGVLTGQTTPLTPEAPVGGYRELYVADLTSGSYQLVSNSLESAEVISPLLLGASEDLSHVLYSKSYVVGDGPSLYEEVNGERINVSVTNSGEPMSAAAGGANGRGDDTQNERDWHALSADGSRVAFTSPYLQEGEEGNVYVRVNVGEPQSPVDQAGVCTVAGDACTVEVSASQRGEPDSHGSFRARYRGASADGSRVFFTSRLELTEDAFTGSADNAANLYEYNFERPEGERLKDLTVDTTDVEGAGVLGVAQMSEDGSYVYFVAKGALTGGEQNAQGDAAQAGQANLYVIHDNGMPRFIGTLENGDTEPEKDERTNEGGDASDWSNNLTINQADVSPSGTLLAFRSQRSVTGYDNEQAEHSELPKGECHRGASKHLCMEVYLYDAVSGGLACVSCNPSGARPLGESSLNSLYVPEEQLYKQRQFSEDGSRLFFQSFDALSPHDSNGRQDVYEYAGGHVYAISDDAGSHDSFFLDASPSGSDVFLATADQLLRQDTDLRLDIYDARVGGGFPVNVSLPTCDNGDSCKPPPAAQPGVFGAPASATFSGAGNITPVVTSKPAAKRVKPKVCKKGFVKRRGKCVRRKARRSGSHSKRGRK